MSTPITLFSAKEAYPYSLPAQIQQLRLPCESILWRPHLKKLKRVAFPFFRGSSQPRDWTQVSHITGDSLPAEPQGKPKNTEVGSLSLLQQIFLTQELNQGLLRCRYSLPNSRLYYIYVNAGLTSVFVIEMVIMESCHSHTVWGSTCIIIKYCIIFYCLIKLLYILSSQIELNFLETGNKLFIFNFICRTPNRDGDSSGTCKPLLIQFSHHVDEKPRPRLFSKNS